MQEQQSPASFRHLWLGLIAATVAFALGFACEVPLATLGAVAALTLSRRDALMLNGAVWLANQIVGFCRAELPLDGRDSGLWRHPRRGGRADNDGRATSSAASRGNRPDRGVMRGVCRGICRLRRGAVHGIGLGDGRNGGLRAGDRGRDLDHQRRRLRRAAGAEPVGRDHRPRRQARDSSATPSRRREHKLACAHGRRTRDQQSNSAIKPKSICSCMWQWNRLRPG